MAEKNINKITRRDVLKSLSTIPLFGVFAYDYWKKKTEENLKKKPFNVKLNLDSKKSSQAPAVAKNSGQVLKLGVIGVGSRATALLKALGFLDPLSYESILKNSKTPEKANARLQSFFNQSMLNVQVVAVCDVFDLHRDKGVRIVSKGMQPNGEAADFKGVKKYKRYQDLLADKEIDAVIVATPDFHHAEITIAAAKAGKHVYCEKAMTRTEEELHEVYKTVKNSGIVFQLGHQLSKSESYKRAREAVEKNIIGKITLIETTTNRNTPSGAWIRHLDSKGNLKPGSPKTIDWDLWLGNAPKVPFSIERYYDWPKWFDYDTGLAGQLFSHEIDGVNQIMGFGIPKTVTSSGGIYYYKDERDMPDTFQSVLEFPDRGFTVVYSASLANSRSRGRVYMGHDGSMEVGGSLKILADGNSTKYKDKIRSGLIKTSQPIYSYPKKNIEIDGLTTATEKYYAERGLMNTSVGGKSIDITHLHIKEWVEAIRNGGDTACNIEKAFMDTVSVLMVHKSYVEKRRLEWDPVKMRII
jgi:predicted dehydrogenase